MVFKPSLHTIDYSIGYMLLEFCSQIDSDLSRVFEKLSDPLHLISNGKSNIYALSDFDKPIKSMRANLNKV